MRKNRPLIFHYVCDQKGLNVVAEEVNKEYQKSLEEVSIPRIVLSIICPLIPLIFAVIAAFATLYISYLAGQITERDARYNLALSRLGNPQAREECYRNHQNYTKSLRESYYAAIDGVSFAT